MPEQRVDTVRLMTLARAYCHSAILFSAVDIDLFTAVAHGNDSADRLAVALDLNPLDAERMVTACLALGLLTWDGERLVDAPDVQRYLVRGEESYAGPWMVFGEMLYDDRTGPIDAALWGLGELVYGSGGKAHTVGQCRGYFEKAGFVAVADHEFVPRLLHRVSGTKPA